MAQKLIKAVWRGPFVAEFNGPEPLQPGETREVTEDDLKSAHWEPVEHHGRAPKAEVSA